MDTALLQSIAATLGLSPEEAMAILGGTQPPTVQQPQLPTVQQPAVQQPQLPTAQQRVSNQQKMSSTQGDTTSAILGAATPFVAAASPEAAVAMMAINTASQIFGENNQKKQKAETQTNNTLDEDTGIAQRPPGILGQVNVTSGAWQLGGLSGNWGGKRDEEKLYAKAVRHRVEEQTRQEKMQRKLLDPTGMLQDGEGGSNGTLYALAAAGNWTRNPLVAQSVIKMVGGKPLTNRELLLNWIRPPGLPVYAVANETAAYNRKIKNQLMIRRMGALATGIGMLKALGLL